MGGWHSLRDTREDPSLLGLHRRPLLLWRIPNDAHRIRKSRIESEQPPVPAFPRKNADAQRHWIQAVARRTTGPTSPRAPPSPASSAPVAVRERHIRCALAAIGQGNDGYLGVGSRFPDTVKDTGPLLPR